MENGEALPHGASSPTGLTAEEAARLLREHGGNVLPESAPTSMLRRFLRQFRSPLIAILLFALVFDLGTWVHDGMAGWPLEVLVIATILLVNAALGVVQEYRSEQALARLRQLSAPRSWVLRDGRLTDVPSAELVPGDLVRLESGDRVPADGTAHDPRGLLLDESVLTGESLPVDRAEGGELLSGTLAVRGTALLHVTRTGERSAMGRLAQLVGGIDAGTTPLERRLDAFARRVALWVFVLAALLVVVGVTAGGVSQFGPVLLFAVALAVAVVPEGLPAVITLTLAHGVQRMARRKAVVRRLASVEALGSVTVIATDKTGTLTENRLQVREVVADDEPLALLAMVLANDADTEAGDPLDRALLEHVVAQGLDPAALRAAHPRVSGRPFDSEWKFVRVTVTGGAGPAAIGPRETRAAEPRATHDAGRGGATSFLKGAPEVLLERSALQAGEDDTWRSRADELAAQGYRVLGLASGEGEAEEGLRFLGLVALWDPPRAEVPAAISAAQRAGVRVLMITGDHPATALAIARDLGLAGEGSRAMTGAELAGLTPEALREAVRGNSVFARVAPEHKLAIVEALRADGQVVAVTGDGVNDAPALQRADVGVAMGQRGSDVSREVADLVLLDDNFATIVTAIEEGRGLYANIQGFLRFLFSTNAAEALLILGGTAAAWMLDLKDPSGGLLLPLTAVQILWVNLITDGPPALALGTDRHRHVLDRPPRAPRAPLLDRLSLRFVLLSGLLKAGVAGALLVGLALAGVPVLGARTAVFLYTTIAQLAFAYPARRLGARPEPNRLLHLALAGAGAVQLLALLFPPLRDALGLVSLDAATWGVVAVAIAATWAGAELTGRLLERAAARATGAAPSAGVTAGGRPQERSAGSDEARRTAR